MKKLDLNNSNDLNALKESLNNVIDKKIAEQQLNEKIAEMSNLSFGEYKVLLENVLDELYDTKAGKKCIADYIKLVTENKAINSLYKLFESISDYNPEDATLKSYALADVCEGVDKKMLAEGEKKMYSIYRNAVKHCKGITCESIDEVLDANKQLNESVSFLSHTSDKTNVKQVNTRTESIKVLCESIKNNTNVADEELNESKSNKELLSDLHNLLEGNCSDWERKVLKDISLNNMSDGTKEELFETYKKDCINAIDSLDDDDLDKNTRMFAMKQQLQEKKYNEETFTDDLFKLAELKETILES